MAGLIIYWFSSTSFWQSLANDTFTSAGFYAQRVYVRVIEAAVALGLIGGLVVLLVRVIAGTFKEDKPPKPVLAQSDYEKQTMMATRKEVGSLRKSEDYLRFAAQKGKAPEAWNWQTRRRVKREKAARDNLPDISSESEDDPSNFLPLDLEPEPQPEAEPELESELEPKPEAQVRAKADLGAPNPPGPKTIPVEIIE